MHVIKDIYSTIKDNEEDTAYAIDSLFTNINKRQ